MPDLPRRLRIAQIAPLVERVPPKKYGGTERIVHVLTEELVRRGHEVTLFASGDSLTSAKLFSVYPRGLREARLKDLYGSNVFTQLSIGLAYGLQDEYDIIHDHLGYLSLPTANIAHVPTVFTIHNAFSPINRRIFTALNRPHYVAISYAQARLAPPVKINDVVYNGLPMQSYPFSKEHDDYLLFVGRISFEKGVHYAIEVAQALNLPLIIAAKLDQATDDLPYFRTYIEPRLNNESVRWIGEVDEDERNRLMSRALCLLHPVTWPEPFGLTLIEAMACGCPVVAFRRGSIPEVVVHGRTGYVVRDVEGMIEAVEKIDRISRAACRRRVLKHFNAERMTEGYESIYYKIAGNLS